MQLTPARVHVKATVPSGDSLVGVIPHNVFRLERVKLSRNESLLLITCDHEVVTFDDSVHDVRSKHGPCTLGIGNHVSLFVRNLSSEPQPLELQILGSIVDGPERVPGQPAPEIGRKLVLGVIAQEADADALPVASPDIQKLGDAETTHLTTMVEVAPSFYRVYTNDDGCFECVDPASVERFNRLRDQIVETAFKAGINVAQLCPILIELAARGLHRGMTRETFLRNAEFWFDSATLATTSTQVNTVGGAA